MALCWDVFRWGFAIQVKDLNNQSENEMKEQTEGDSNQGGGT